MAKKKILLMSDDLRFHSGISTVSRDMVMGTLKNYNWVQIAAIPDHPEKFKIVDLSEEAKNRTGIEDASVKLYCHPDYGNPVTLRKIMDLEKPDAILHFTDPRFWGWLYNMEHEVRQKVPLMYLNIWDDIPFPMWNYPFYASCDLLMAISKQTYAINHAVLNRHNDWTDRGRITYVPHGVDTTMYYPITNGDKHWDAFKQEDKNLRGENGDKFLVFWNNRNIHRKHPGDVVLAYKHMCELIDADGKDTAKDTCTMLMHTQPIDYNGTDIVAVVEELCPKYPVKFSAQPLASEALNILYNVADVVINIASNEGFGIGTTEALAAGTPIVVNVTGGLQDQCGFINPKTNAYFTADEYIVVQSLHDRAEWGTLKHGEWVKPVWPSNLSLQGSPQTPYIFDDRADYKETGRKMYEWYCKTREERKACGLKGREYLIDPQTSLCRDTMCERIVESIDTCLNNFTPRRKYELLAV